MSDITKGQIQQMFKEQQDASILFSDHIADALQYESQIPMVNATGDNINQHLYTVLQMKYQGYWPVFITDMLTVVDLVLRNVMRTAPTDNPKATYSIYQLRKLMVSLHQRQLGHTVPRGIIGEYFDLLTQYVNHHNEGLTVAQVTIFYRLGAKFLKSYMETLLNSLEATIRTEIPPEKNDEH